MAQQNDEGSTKKVREQAPELSRDATETARGPHDSNGSSTAKVYRVEARSASDVPVILGEQIITRRWVCLHFDRSPGGVPNKVHDPQAVLQGFYDFAAATALMAWSGAEAGPLPAVEFRLRQYEFQSSWRVRSLGVGETVNLFEQWRTAKFAPETETP